jgi:hypothetical protein
MADLESALPPAGEFIADERNYTNVPSKVEISGVFAIALSRVLATRPGCHEIFERQ